MAHKSKSSISEQLNAAQITAAGSQFQSTSNLKAAEATARDAYQALAKVACAVFINDSARLAQLGLNSAMPRTIAAFISAAYAMLLTSRK